MDRDHEYQLYLERFAATRTGEPLTREDFEIVCNRWDKEYHAAWDYERDHGVGVGVPPVVVELEHLMCV